MLVMYEFSSGRGHGLTFCKGSGSLLNDDLSELESTRDALLNPGTSLASDSSLPNVFKKVLCLMYIH